MIYLDSRYADGNLAQVWDARKSKREYQLTVMRQWPSYTEQFFTYQWVDGDRLDQVAARFLPSPDLWWQIMDLNPEITCPIMIAPGTVLRIPND